MEDVVAYLLPPFRLHHVATDLFDLRCTLFLCDHQQLSFEPTESLYFVGQLTPLLCKVEHCRTNVRFMSYKLQLLPILDFKDILLCGTDNPELEKAEKIFPIKYGQD